MSKQRLLRVILRVIDGAMVFYFNPVMLRPLMAWGNITRRAAIAVLEHDHCAFWLGLYDCSAVPAEIGNNFMKHVSCGPKLDIRSLKSKRWLEDVGLQRCITILFAFRNGYNKDWIALAQQI